MSPPGDFGYVDAHVHLHPPWLAAAIRRWFSEHTDWRLTYPTEPEPVARFLRERRVERFVFFSYAHKPGIARGINRWLRETARQLPDGIPLGTVHPGDADLRSGAEEALSSFGFAGLKMHIEVQRFYPDDPRVLWVYERLARLDRVLVIHVTGAAESNQYVGVERFARVMERFPELRACICHMGVPQTAACLRLMSRFPHLFLDTTMAMSEVGLRSLGKAPEPASAELVVRWQDRIIFGSDFPILPYDYEEERRWAWERDLPPEVRRKVFGANARRFLQLEQEGGEGV